MNTVKFLKIAIALLFLLNIATLSFYWLSAPSVHGRHPGRGGGPGEYLVHELKLDEMQQQKYQHMRDDHFSHMMMLRKKATGYRQRINTQLKATSPDSLMVQHLSDSIGYCQRDLELLTFYHFRELRSICSPKQQQRFDEVIHDAIEVIVH
jgi:protein CpxP